MQQTDFSFTLNELSYILEKLKENKITKPEFMNIIHNLKSLKDIISLEPDSESEKITKSITKSPHKILILKIQNEDPNKYYLIDEIIDTPAGCMHVYGATPDLYFSIKYLEMFYKVHNSVAIGRIIVDKCKSLNKLMYIFNQSKPSKYAYHETNYVNKEGLMEVLCTMQHQKKEELIKYFADYCNMKIMEN
jgi:hypothetical protein